MGFPSSRQKPMFITSVTMILSKRQEKQKDIYSEHFIILFEWSCGAERVLLLGTTIRIRDLSPVTTN